MRYGRMALIAVLAFRAVAAAAAAPAVPAGEAAGAADAPGAVEAVWIERKLSFVYSARTAWYSCDGLAIKVEQILAAIGARPGYTVQPRACFNPRRGAEWTPMLDITAASAVAATPATLDEAGRQAEQQAIAARAGGAKGPVEATTAPFRAVTRRIDLRDSPRGLLQPGDCELVQQLRDQVFKPLGAKVVDDHMACTYHRLDNNIIRLSIEVLVPEETPAG
ncbi:MAG: hypothetical protein U1F08_12385 [Steroidobacteraceae bacterium]